MLSLTKPTDPRIIETTNTGAPMQQFRTIPFHLFQDHCCERRLKYLQVPNYYLIACSLAGVDQCNPHMCPVWNGPIPGPQPVVDPVARSMPRLPQSPMQQPGPAAPVTMPVPAQSAMRPPMPPPVRPAAPRIPVPALVVPPVQASGPLSGPLPVREPLVAPEGSSSSLRDINLRLKESAAASRSGAPGPSRPAGSGRRRRGGRGRGGAAGPAASPAK